MRKGKFHRRERIGGLLQEYDHKAASVFGPNEIALLLSPDNPLVFQHPTRPMPTYRKTRRANGDLKEIYRYTRRTWGRA
jgi:hypothetical protein